MAHDMTPILKMEEWVDPPIDHLITEDDTPVDNLPSSKLQRCMISPIYDSGYLPPPFLADSNVGIFYTPHRPPIVPDMFISLGVEVEDDWWAKAHRSYFVWEFGKPPDVVVEIVSNTAGGETDGKMKIYATIGIDYYVIYDPQLYVQEQELIVYELIGGRYQPRSDWRLPNIGLSLTLWNGVFEGKRDRWLRWCDMFGTLLYTGAELATQERMRTEQARAQTEEAQIQADQERIRAEEAQVQAERERIRAEEAQAKAEQAQAQAEQYAAKLRELGIDPASL